MSELSPLLIAAVLLTQFVIAQHIGLRALISLREAIGVSATLICTLPIAATLDWMVLHAMLQPFAIAYLHLYIGVVLTAAMTPLVEVLLRSHRAQWFPPIGSLLPLTMTTCCTLIAAQIIAKPEAAFLQTVFDAIGLGLGAAALLTVLHTLRERSMERPKLLFNIVADDMLHAVFILVALRGVLSIWR